MAFYWPARWIGNIDLKSGEGLGITRALADHEHTVLRTYYWA